MSGFLSDKDRWQLYVVVCFALPIGGILLEDAVKRYNTAGKPLLAGKVIGVIPKQSGWELRPVVEIDVDRHDFNVRARLQMDTAKDFPQRVTFYYGGDPADEVHLREETNPLWGALFFLILPVGILAANRLACRRALRRTAAATIGGEG